MGNVENLTKEERIAKINYAEKVLKEAENVRDASITREEQYNSFQARVSKYSPDRLKR